MAQETDVLSFINLLIRNKDLAEEWFEGSNAIEVFHSIYKPILQAIEFHLSHNEKLTRKGFNTYLENFISEKEKRVSLYQLYTKISFLETNRDDFYALKTNIIESFLRRKSADIIRTFEKDVNSGTAIVAVNHLYDRVQDLNLATEVRKKIIYESLSDYLPHHIENMAIDTPEDMVKCHIKEIDDSMPSGFDVGTLTLFSGDVSAGKTTVMMNVALNIWKLSNINVLFVPLEMPKKPFTRKIISRETEIPFDKLISKKLLSDDEWKRVVDFAEASKKLPSSFYVMEVEDRTRVSVIRREIERHLHVFQPRLVVVDYIANLVPDHSRDNRNDLEIGDMLKDLRQMGRHLQFAVISACQLGREALKRIKLGGDKYIPSSTDLRGSHEYSADSDDIFALVPDPQQQSHRLNLYRIKSRYGDKKFKNGTFKATLEMRPEISLVRSLDEFPNDADQDKILAMAQDVSHNETSVVVQDNTFDVDNW